MIDTSKIIPTHNRFRNPQKAKELIDVKEYCDYILSNQRGQIILIQTEDNQLWCHDGHHRLAAIDWHYGKLCESYIEVKEYSYAQLNEINLNVGYVTPYDPRTHCRLENFWEFKNEIINHIEYIEYKLSYTEEELKTIAKMYCLNNSNKYKQSRSVHTLRELCNTILLSPTN